MVSKGKIHAIAKCRICNWEEQNYQTAQAKARYHFKKYGHIVDVEVGTWYVIGEEQ